MLSDIEMLKLFGCIAKMRSFWQFKCHFNLVYIYIYNFEGDGMKIYVVLSNIGTEKLGFS